MVHLLPLFFALAGFSSLAHAQYGYGGGYGTPVASTTPPSSSGSAANSNNVSPSNAVSPSAVGDVQCGPFMCIGAAVKGNNIEYVMQSTGTQMPGWMAMGFGDGMVGSPMVVMWANADGSFSLSQRQAKDHVLPAVVPNPTRVATVSVDLSVATGQQPKFAYTIPMDGNMQPQLIWAFGTDMPTAAQPSRATFLQHVGFGQMTLNLNSNTSVSILESPALSLESNNGSGQPAKKTSSAEMVVLAHAIVCAVAFLVIMPAGALLARYYRTFSPTWFKGHWILQFGISAPFVLAGAILAFSISHVGGPKVWNTHTQVGVLLFSLYVVQCMLGSIIHFWKPKNMKGRPPQNYAHAVLGITIIALAFFQVRTGYKWEWPNVSGQAAPMAIDVLWYIWVVVIPLAYFGGLAFLKKQYRQEKESREQKAAQPKPWEQRSKGGFGAFPQEREYHYEKRGYGNYGNGNYGNRV